VGGAEISPKHANYFVNTGGATAADVRALIARARADVYQRFGAVLQAEVKLIRPDGSVDTLPPPDDGTSHA
jgi:UDP-N-acetylmuramate dehydrogenase